MFENLKKMFWSMATIQIFFIGFGGYFYLMRKQKKELLLIKDETKNKLKKD